MNIINTDIIKDTQDIFWQLPQQVQGLTAKPVLIISKPFAAGSPESEQLNGILKSGCQLAEAQYHIIFVNDDEQISWHQLRNVLQPRVVLLFNVIPSHLGIASLFRLNEINRFDSGYWVPTLSLTNIIEDKALKGSLWNNALKPLFVGKLHGEVV